MTYKLVSFALCPFVQRSVITLQEKGAAYEIEYIDLASKPEWFLKVSPFGKVPVLMVEDTVLFESAVINEYLDEVLPGDRLHPADPLRKAYDRAWIEFGSALLVDYYRLTVAGDEDTATRWATACRDKMARLQEQLEGPYFGGEGFSLVDAALAPAMQRLLWADELAPGLGLFKGLDRMKAYGAALVSRPSVGASTVPEIRELFADYLKGKHSPTRTVDPSWLGTLL